MDYMRKILKQMRYTVDTFSSRGVEWSKVPTVPVQILANKLTIRCEDGDEAMALIGRFLPRLKTLQIDAEDNSQPLVPRRMFDLETVIRTSEQLYCTYTDVTAVQLQKLNVKHFAIRAVTMDCDEMNQFIKMWTDGLLSERIMHCVFREFRNIDQRVMLKDVAESATFDGFRKPEHEMRAEFNRFFEHPPPASNVHQIRQKDNMRTCIMAVINTDVHFRFSKDNSNMTRF
ncbi:unnamed protein product [Caenorhabditis bovis]|nr:unnamed protein product [Caenorhabditis bovis]